jgi:hypothetical protein
MWLMTGAEIELTMSRTDPASRRAEPNQAKQPGIVCSGVR